MLLPEFARVITLSDFLQAISNYKFQIIRACAVRALESVGLCVTRVDSRAHLAASLVTLATRSRNQELSAANLPPTGLLAVVWVRCLVLEGYKCLLLRGKQGDTNNGKRTKTMLQVFIYQGTNKFITARNRIM